MSEVTAREVKGWFMPVIDTRNGQSGPFNSVRQTHPAPPPPAQDFSYHENYYTVVSKCSPE